jgi:hypothetical protein
MLWNGCTADVDLDNIDTSVDVEANVATPIGSMTATIDDFVGDGTWGIFIDTVNHEGVITFRDTFSIARDFHKLDLSKYISRTRLKLNIYEPLNKAGLMNNNQITGNGVQIPLTFPLTLKLKGINQDIDAQRIDSALIKNASFTSKLTAIDGSPIKWEWIDKVTLDLGDRCYRPEGNIVTVYDKKKDTYGYRQDIPTNIDEFSINLMKNKEPQKWNEYVNNVVDSCTFNVTIYLTIPTSAGAIQVPSTAAFQYDLGVQFIDYHAVWGMFEPSKDMSGEAVEAIATYWSPWNTLQDLRLPFAEPRVDMQVTTQVAGAMIMEGDYLYTENKEGVKAYATFDGKHSLYKYFTPNEYLPLSSPIGTATTMHILFDKDPSRGHIDKLFSIRPDKIGYKFSVWFNEQETPQIRLTKNTSIKIDAVCNLPMILNDSVSLGYSDKIKGIDLSMLDLDSLLKDVEMIDTLEEASAKLVIKFENSIPLQFKGMLKCLDENDSVIIDPKTAQPLLLTENDTILIAAPEFKENEQTHNWDPTPLESVEVINVDREDLETLRKIKTIEFHTWMDDESLDGAYEKGMNNIQLKDNNYLKVKIAVGANVEGVLNLEF